ncbi:MAG TPA: hypothetical protein VF321_05655 [Gaiellaceae bacterium]
MSRRSLLLPALCLFALVAPAAAVAMTLPGISSPTGNIRCLFLGAPSRDLLCTLDHADYAARLQARCLGPNGEGVDWHGFILGPAGKGLVNCSGGILYDPSTQHPRYSKLAYGRTRRLGAFTCSSRRTGLTCTNGRANGLFLSRESWRAW